jgi:LacI family transcriptional regulator
MKHSQRSSVRLRDIAKAAGVSLAAVSLALNNAQGVSITTRQRVVETAQRLGYQPVRRQSIGNHRHAVARIGALIKRNINSDAPDWFNLGILGGIERACRRYKVNLMFNYLVVDQYSRVEHYPPMLLDEHIDGLLIVGALLEESLSDIRSTLTRPIVLIDANALGNDFDQVVTDNTLCAYEAVSHLIANGHRHIGLIGYDRRAHPSIIERYEGYMRALRAHNIADVYVETSLLTRSAAAEATEHLLTRAPQVTAIFACNDDTAIGVMNAARRMRRKLPAQLSVIGFDGWELGAEISPMLTTMRVNTGVMGEMGVRSLLERAQHPDNPRVKVVLKADLLVRESVVALPTR